MIDVKLVFEAMDGMKTVNYSWPSPFPLPIQYYCYWCSYIQSFTPLVSTKVLVFGAQNPIMYSILKCLYRQGSTDYKCWLITARTEWKPFIRHLAQVMVKAVQRTQAERSWCIIRDRLPASGWFDDIVIMMQFGRTAGVI